MLDTIEQYIDQYLKLAGYAMTSSEIFEWKKMIDDLNKHEVMERKKGKISNHTSNRKLDRRKLVENEKWKESSDNQRSGKIYHQTCKIYQRAIALAQEEWKLLVDRIVTALRYNAINSHFIAKLDYSKDGTEKMEEMIIPVEWFVDVYGHEIMSKLME